MVAGINPLAGIIRRNGSNDRARESENPLALFEAAESSYGRRRRYRRGASVAHLRYGRLDPAIENSLEIVRPELSELDEAEIERLAEIARSLEA